MQQQLTDLLERLQGAFHTSLVSVILYGSGATGERDAGFSDLNVVCVLKQITPVELSQAEPVWSWWSALGHPAPLLLSEEEVHHSADSFPLEFRDMSERRKVLYGPDLIADLKIEHTHHRTILERELRVNLLRLRQKAAAILSDPAKLLHLCAESVTTFCVLGRHLLLASGATVEYRRREVVAQLHTRLKIDTEPLSRLLDVRETKAASGVDAQTLFAEYLKTIEAMVRHADQL